MNNLGRRGKIKVWQSRINPKFMRTKLSFCGKSHISNKFKGKISVFLRFHVIILVRATPEDKVFVEQGLKNFPS